MRTQRKRMVMMMMVAMVVVTLSCLSLLTFTQQANTNTFKQNKQTHKQVTNTIPGGANTITEEERRKIIKKEKEKEKEEEVKRRRMEEERYIRIQELRKKEEEEERKKKEKMKEEETKGGRENGGKRGGKSGGKGFIRRDFWVDEMEEYSPSSVNLEEMEEEMRRRRRRVEERCGEILTEEERRREINSQEFLISKPYKLIWCNIFKAASSTWMYNYLRMAGESPEKLKNLKTSPVEAARYLYPRPSPGELRAYLGKSGNGGGETGDGWGNAGEYLSFIIVREPFQRLLSAYRDKIENEVPYYRSIRCMMIQENGTERKMSLLHPKRCSPTFSQFVDYVLRVEKEGGAHNEHWTPYYRFCTPCSAHFDMILRFESLQKDEMYLLQRVPGLSKVVSPKVMHSSHANYSSIVAKYYSQLTSGQLLGLVKMYLPDFWLFGYNERPYLDLVL